MKTSSTCGVSRPRPVGSQYPAAQHPSFHVIGPVQTVAARSGTLVVAHKVGKSMHRLSRGRARMRPFAFETGEALFRHTWHIASALLTVVDHIHATAICC